MSAARRACVRGLLACEADGAAPDALAPRLEAALARLCTPLGELVGHAGLQALADRACALAARELPWTDGVKLRVADRGVTLEHLTECAAGRGADAALDAAATIAAEVLGLFYNFIGEGLTLRVLARTWPEAASQLGAAKAPPEGRR